MSTRMEGSSRAPRAPSRVKLPPPIPSPSAGVRMPARRVGYSSPVLPVPFPVRPSVIVAVPLPRPSAGSGPFPSRNAQPGVKSYERSVEKRMKKKSLLFWLCTLSPGLCRAQAASGLQSSNLLNPNISAIGWFQGEAGNRFAHPGKAAPAPLRLQETELGFQSVVDPYAKADFFISVGGDGAVELEEGTINWFSLPGGLALKAGKFRADFGRFNRTHTPETAFADRPLAQERFFGEGLSGTGAALSWHVPNPWVLASLDLNAVNTPPAADAPAFGAARRRDLLYVGRLGAYCDLGEAAGLSLGFSGARGAAGYDTDPLSLPSSTSTALSSTLAGLDMTLRWKDPARAIYRSAFWQTEMIWSKREAPGYSSVGKDSSAGSFGLFSHLEYQFARRWRAGTRYDYTQLPADRSRHEAGGLAYVTFMPSEFSLLSLQGRRALRSDGTKESLGMLKATFNIGPHGAHPF